MMVLRLYQNELTGPLPSAVECRRLCKIIAFDNGFNGDMENLRGSLNSLDIRSNNSSGEIPANLKKSDASHIIALNTNNLGGQIPLIWGKPFASHMA